MVGITSDWEEPVGIRNKNLPTRVLVHRARVQTRSQGLVSHSVGKIVRPASSRLCLTPLPPRPVYEKNVTNLSVRFLRTALERDGSVQGVLVMGFESWRH